MYRLAVFPIHLPPLAEREGDAELIAELFLSQLNERAGSSKRFSRAALSAIRDYSWPGNVRELKNAVQRAFIMAEEVVDINLGQLAGPEVDRRLSQVPRGHVARGDGEAGDLRDAGSLQGQQAALRGDPRREPQDAV